MTEPSADQTLIQFACAMRDQYLAENPDLGISKAEYDRLYPPESRWHEWTEAIWRAAASGAVLRRQVLDDLHRRSEQVAWQIVKHYPNAFPSGYWFPTTRAWNAAREREKRQARQRGRIAAIAAEEGEP